MRVGPNEYFVAGAPRSNHSGQVIVYTVDAQKQSHIIDSQRGKQVLIWFKMSDSCDVKCKDQS